ncbi:MAG: hypothetical protein WD178_06545, partial [Actinomycetota bacterium]
RPASAGAVRLAYTILARTAVDLLPGWGRSMLDLRRTRFAEPLTKAYFASLRLAVPTVPRALREAQQRAAAPPVG